MNFRDCEGRAGMPSSKVPEYALASEIRRVGAGYTRKCEKDQWDKLRVSTAFIIQGRDC